jgi:aspartyl protease family protein
MPSFSRTIVLVALTTVGTAFASVPLEVVGLFKDRVVVREPGGQRLLSVGETTPSGVTLLKADSREALVAFEGQHHTITLSNRVIGGYAPSQTSEVSIPADDLGQYRIRGAINDRYVDFLVDTGASVVAMSSNAAESLGIDYSRAQRGAVQTAQGNAESWFMTLSEVTVAGLTARNVQAAIIKGHYPVDILLGMSFLKQVSMTENAGVMTLVQKY